MWPLRGPSIADVLMAGQRDARRRYRLENRERHRHGRAGYGSCATVGPTTLLRRPRASSGAAFRKKYRP
jgi:hypothetical protein